MNPPSLLQIALQPTRLRILQTLRTRPLNQAQLAVLLHLKRQTVDRHLNLLERAGLVESRLEVPGLPWQIQRIWRLRSAGSDAVLERLAETKRLFEEFRVHPLIRIG